jgi:hypothetical protein
MIYPWDTDKPHRCPDCWAATVDRWPSLRSLWIYTCCMCGEQFTRWPVLWVFLPRATIRCVEHNPKLKRWKYL